MAPFAPTSRAGRRGAHWRRRRRSPPPRPVSGCPPDDLTDGALLVVERDHDRNLGRHEIEPTIRFSVDAAALLAERVQELRDDRSHGASWMARRAVETLAELTKLDVPSCDDLLGELKDAGRQLAACRPGVGAVAGAVGRVLAAAGHESHLDLDNLRRLIQEEAQALDDARRRAAASITIQLRERLNGATVITHSASGTVREAFQQTEPAKVLCTVSEPVGEGRAFVDELREAGLDADLVEDGDAPHRVKEAAVLLIG